MAGTTSANPRDSFAPRRVMLGGWLVRPLKSRAASRPAAIAPEPARTIATAAADDRPATVAPDARASPLSEHSIADLMHRVSHEIRTPLNAVIGFSDVMQRELLGPLGHKRYREYVHHISDCGADLLKAAEDTLAMTSLVANPRLGDEQVVRLGAALRDAVERMQPQARFLEVRIEAEIDSDIEVRADPRALRQVLVNLLTAALRRARPGSAIEITSLVSCASVRISLVVADARPAGSGNDLPLCLARTLLELQGLALSEGQGGSTWRASTVLEAVTQRDFFGASTAA